MSTRYKGSILSSTEASSSSTAAYGIWKQSEVAQLINIAWPVNDPNFSSVSMLLHGDGTAGSQNNTFIDSSSNNFTITRNGTATQGSFNPFGLIAPYTAAVDGGSGYFAPTSYLSATGNATTAMGTGAFTWECWVYVPAATTYQTFIETRSNPTVGASNGFAFALDTGTLTPMVYTTALLGSSSINVTANAWNHVAITRSGTTLTFWVNGASGGTITNSTNLSNQTLSVGGSVAPNIHLTGFLASVRMVKGTAVYTTAFTPPTAPLTAISGTSFLLNFTNAGIVDNAMQNNFITVGTAQISNTIYKYGTGSMSFSGSGAWLTTIDRTSLQLGTGDFTIEGWVYANAIGTAYAIVSKGTASTGWSVGITSGNLLQFAYTAATLNGATSLIAGTWYYFAVVRSGSGSGNLKIYLNGTADATSGGAVTDNFNQTSILYVGASRTGTTPLNGYIDDLRITKGVARYTANFTAPQSAFPNQ